MNISPDHCTNQDCPFWDISSEEGCSKPDPPNEDWIQKYCDKQSSQPSNAADGERGCDPGFLIKGDQIYDFTR